jgi:hypothetical protein
MTEDLIAALADELLTNPWWAVLLLVMLALSGVLF